MVSDLFKVTSPLAAMLDLHSIGSHLGSNLATPPTNQVSLL